MPEAAPSAVRPDGPGTDAVVATAMDVVTPLGHDLDASFAAMAAGRSGIRHVTRFETKGLFCDIAGELDDAWLAPADERSALAGTGWQVVAPLLDRLRAEARLDDIADRGRIAVVLGGHGTTPQVADIARTSRHWKADGDGIDLAAALADKDFDASAWTQRQPDVLLAVIAEALRAEGPTIPIVSACAAGTQAIGEGLRLLREGRADVVVAGGAEPLLCYTGYLGFSILGALTRRYPAPEKASRPFDRRRNGFVIAEGAGLVVLERATDAARRGRTPLGAVLGYGDSADAHLITAMHPEGRGAVQAMRMALDDAGLAPEAVGYVNAHGTSTALNDPVETHAIKTVLGPRAHDVPVSSNKSMIGHTIGSAGAIEAILTWRGMAEGVLLPTINQEAPDRRCDLDYVPNEARAGDHDVALSNSFGFGGQNGCLCLGAASRN